MGLLVLLGALAALPGASGQSVFSPDSSRAAGIALPAPTPTNLDQRAPHRGHAVLISSPSSSPPAAPPPASTAPTLPEWRWLLLTLLPAIAAVIIIARYRLWRVPPAQPADPAELPAQRRLWSILALGAALIWLSQALGATSASSVFNLTNDAIRTPRGMALASWGAYTGAALGLLLILLVFPPLARPMGLRARPADAPAGVIGFVLVFPVVSGLGALVLLASRWISATLGTPPPPELAHEALTMLREAPVRGVWWWAAIAAVTLGAPIVEEVLYRGCIQGAIHRLTGSAPFAIALSSLAFILPHTTVVAPHALIVLFVLSIGFGIAMARTGRLGPPIIMHALFNAANIALAMA